MDQQTVTQLRGLVQAAYYLFGIVFAVVGFVIYWRIRSDVEAKRRWFKWGAIAAGVIFAAFGAGYFAIDDRFRGSPRFFVFGSLLAVMVAAFMYVNVKMTKFCTRCGAMQYNWNWVTPMNFCSKCGAPLDVAKPSKDEGLLE